ncbi:hypothetical protein [Flavobacterium sp. GCM10027622]|uniref:hypothetical protein n=1 Tax=unclassified Flavobacterium TaxID=196869 RepID=UPI00361EEE85
MIITNQVSSQKKLFENLKVDGTTKIIGRYPQYDKNKTYEKYNFIIEDSTQIIEFAKTIKLGKEVENSTEDPSFRLTIVKNFEEIGTWTINPTLKSVMTHDGNTYEFDLNQITKLNETFPFKYYFDIKVFNKKSEYEAYLSEQKSNPSFLFDYGPQFKYEGSFEIEFKKSSLFPHPKAISEFLTKYIKKIVAEDEYSIVYILNDKNMKKTDQYTMTISGSEKLFNELKIEKLRNENWQPSVEEAYFFYKK